MSDDSKPLSLDDIDAGVEVVENKQNRNYADKLEEAGLLAKDLENRLTRSRIKDRKADRKLRNTYAGRILRYLEIYSGVVGAMILFQATNPKKFFLPTEVIAILVGSTAVAAIGLVGFIAKGLFRPSKED